MSKEITFYVGDKILRNINIFLPIKIFQNDCYLHLVLSMEKNNNFYDKNIEKEDTNI